MSSDTCYVQQRSRRYNHIGAAGKLTIYFILEIFFCNMATAISGMLILLHERYATKATYKFLPSVNAIVFNKTAILWKTSTIQISCVTFTSLYKFICKCLHVLNHAVFVSNTYSSNRNTEAPYPLWREGSRHSWNKMQMTLMQHFFTFFFVYSIPLPVFTNWTFYHLPSPRTSHTSCFTIPDGPHWALPPYPHPRFHLAIILAADTLQNIRGYL